MSRQRSKVSEVANSVVEGLKSLGLRASRPEDVEGSCLESYVECCGSVIRIVFYGTKYLDDGVLIKLTAGLANCEETMYDPRGLYVIIKGSPRPDDVGRVKTKLQLTAALFSQPSSGT